MTLAWCAAIAGANPKWIQNTLALLGLPLRYDRPLARRLGLTYLIVSALGTPLRAAWGMAGEALVSGSRADRRSDGQWRSHRTGPIALELDVPRYLTEAAVREAGLSQVGIRLRGRPRRWAMHQVGSAVARAEAFGLDLSALRAGLQHTPAERLRALDRNQQLMARLRPATRG